MAKKKAKAKVKKPTKADLLEEADELLRRIEQAEKDCQSALADMQIRKDEYKMAKECYGNAVVELRRLCRARNESHPLFDQAKKNSESNGDAKPADGQIPHIAANWKELPIVTLQQYGSVTAKALDALASADIRTCGELQAKIERHGDFWAKECKVTRARVAIEDALTAMVTHYTPPEQAEVIEPVQEEEDDAAPQEQAACSF